LDATGKIPDYPVGKGSTDYLKTGLLGFNIKWTIENIDTNDFILERFSDWHTELKTINPTHWSNRKIEFRHSHLGHCFYYNLSVNNESTPLSLVEHFL
jgi:hypothetical protein